jgi:hypothetical protein
VVIAMQRESEHVSMDTNSPQHELVAMIRRRNSTKKYRPGFCWVCKAKRTAGVSYWDSYREYRSGQEVIPDYGERTDRRCGYGTGQFGNPRRGTSTLGSR